MSSNLNIKYGNKRKTIIDEETQESQIVSNLPAPNAGTIYAAKNNLNKVELYLDTPLDPNDQNSTTDRVRLDSKVYVGPASIADNINDTTVFEDYDIWFDTSGDEVGTATTSANGLMSTTHVTQLQNLISQYNTLITQLQGLKIRFVAGPWRSELEQSSNNTLTVLMPTDWQGTPFTWSPGSNS